MLTIGEVETPLGSVTLAARGGALCALVFSDGWPRMRQRLARRFGALATLDEAPSRIAGGSALARAAARARAYFAGDLAALDDLAVDVEGTPFQRGVWTALRAIRAGDAISYAELARRVGSPRAVRAVGAANGANPVSLVVPCHRVVQSDGSLGGYAGGLDRKRWLLAHERAAALRAS
jgi:methylated-DNA-[protein]-cysteine S-methyltransferase